MSAAPATSLFQRLFEAYAAVSTISKDGAPSECKPHHSALEASLALFLCMGLIISYLPQIARIIIKKTSLGFSPWFLFLGATSSASSFLNVVALQWGVIRCCQWLTTTACSESLLGLLQVGLQWLLFVIILILFLVYYPKELRYERAIALTGPSNDISAQDITDGYESDSSAGDLDSLDSHIAENYSNFATAEQATTLTGEGALTTPPVNGAEESESNLTTTTTISSSVSGEDDESPNASGLVSNVHLREDEQEVSSSAFDRLVPTFWPVWKAPRKQVPGFTGLPQSSLAGERLPPNAVKPTSSALKATADGDPALGSELPSTPEEGQPGDGAAIAVPAHYEGVRFAPSMTLSSTLSRQERGLRRTRRVKRRTKEWGLALSLSWLVAFHFLFILLVTLLLVSSLPPASFPPPQESSFEEVVVIMGPSSRLLVHRWAAFLGFTSTALAAAQYVPQIIHTARAKLVGSLSIPMMCLQVPGSVIFVYSLALRPGVNYTSLAAYVCTGVLQGVLLVLCIAWRIRERRLGVDDFGRPLP